MSCSDNDTKKRKAFFFTENQFERGFFTAEKSDRIMQNDRKQVWEKNSAARMKTYHLKSTNRKTSRCLTEGISFLAKSNKSNERKAINNLKIRQKNVSNATDTVEHKTKILFAR